MRSILHVDMNNFYASVECLYRPEIRHLPVAVAGLQATRLTDTALYWLKI